MEFERQLAQELKSIDVPDHSTTACSEKISSACFDCSICLDSAHDPVVTLCGHLYCWPCIYKWLEFQKSSVSSDECPQCPVCKAEISHESVVPLYGRGGSQNLSEPESDDKTTPLKLIIPPRPTPTASSRQSQSTVSSSNNLHQRVQSQTPFQNLQNFPYSEDNYEDAISNIGSPTTAVCHPMCGNYGEMVYARVFGNSQRLYAYPNSYHTQGSMSPRLRRMEIKTSKSLNRLSFFIFCCILLCLFLF